MAAPGALTLDISDPQVLIYYEDDTDGFHYHHRVLLYRGGAPGVWIALMPDGELQVHNLIAERHVILQRHSPFPSQHANQVYAFDPISRVELDAHRVRARIQARVRGTAEEDPRVDAALWVIAGPAQDRISEEISAEVLGDPGAFRELGSRAVADVGGMSCSASALTSRTRRSG